MITIKRNPEINDKLVFEMKEEERIVGTITAMLNDDGDLLITELESEQELYYDGLCRAVLAYSVARGVDRAIFAVDGERRLKRLKGFGFITEESRVLESINAFFEHENCG